MAVFDALIDALLAYTLTVVCHMIFLSGGAE
jgi:hypothetical protein